VPGTRAARPRAQARRPVGLGQLVRWGAVISVVLLAFSAVIGGFGVLAFGALAALWALGVAWIIVYGPPSVDRRVLRVYGEQALRTWRETARASLRVTADRGGSLRRDLAGRVAASRSRLSSRRDDHRGPEPAGRPTTPPSVQVGSGQPGRHG
jgi:hypothetical protein